MGQLSQAVQGAARVAPARMAMQKVKL